jgi:sulfofructose kinase
VRIPLIFPPAESKPFDLVGFGENSVDLVAVVAEYPLSNSKQRLQRFARLPGGQIASEMVACARLGLRTRYVGSFGGDDLGALARDTLLREGVDVSAARIVSTAANRFAVILVDARSGERTVLWDRHPDLHTNPAQMPEAALTSGRMLVVDCYEAAASTGAARCARDAAVPTMIDVEKVRPGIAELLQNIDVIIATGSFPMELTGCDGLGRALETMGRELGAAIVCATLGDAGSLAWCGGREIRTRAFPVDCVDSTGAGDAFRGAFAAGCLAHPEGDLEDMLRYANAAAALNCRALGAQTGLPRPDEVERLLAAWPPT